MVSKNELQNALKEKFGINKNISQSLSQQECEELLNLLAIKPSAAKLISSYADKNSSLGRNNATFGMARSRAEGKLEDLQARHLQLKEYTESIEQDNKALESKKENLEEQQKQLQSNVQTLSSKNKFLNSNFQNLTTQNNQLAEANTKLNNELAEASRKLNTKTEDLQKIEEANAKIESRKKLLEKQQNQLKAELESLSKEKDALSSKVEDLTEVNAELKKENKDLKNIVDQIRLRLARDTKALLEYEDSEIRKAVIRLFRWTLG
jgi:chromosome segregation ATPase